MGKRMRYALLLCVPLLGLAGWYGCRSREKSTPELIADLKSPDEKDRVIAARTLPLRKGDAAQVVPALIGSLKDHDADIRRSAAIGLGGYGEAAREAIPFLQAALGDHDARVREAAGVALSRIDPSRFSAPTRPPRKGR